jgi:NAD-dependent dihydropyrimidine dehydrogenase PreA subunit
MAMKIDFDACVDCAACAEPCPNQAILRGGESWTFRGVAHEPLSEKYFVVPDFCTECVGHYDAPQCVVACPVDCIQVDPGRRESKEELEGKLATLKKRGVK